MNINQLKYFISVAEYRSFTKAANQFLHLPDSDHPADSGIGRKYGRDPH